MSHESDSLSLDLAGRRIVVRVDEPGAFELVSLLWEPVAGGDAEGAETVSVTALPEGWLMSTPFGISEYGSVHVPDRWQVADVLRMVFIDHALDNDGLIGLHAAAVSNGETGVLIFGESGRGKTSLCLELLGRGWSYVGDDPAIMDRATGLLIPFAKPFRVEDVALWDKYAPHWSPPSWLGPRTEGFQFPASAAGVAAPAPVTVTHLIYLAPHGSPVGSRALSVAEALTLSGEGMRPLDPAALTSLRQVCEAARRFELAAEGPPVAADNVEEMCRDGGAESHVQGGLQGVI